MPLTVPVKEDYNLVVYHCDVKVQDLGRGDGVVELLVAVVLAVGRGQDGDDHGDGAVAVQQTHDNTYPPY